MKKLIVLAFLLAGCMSGPTEQDLTARRGAVADAKLKYEEGVKAHAANLDVLLAELQLADTEYAAAKAAAVRERVSAGAGYVEVGSKLVGSSLAIAFPLLGSALATVAAGAGLLRQALAKPAAKLIGVIKP